MKITEPRQGPAIVTSIVEDETGAKWLWVRFEDGVEQLAPQEWFNRED